MFEHPHESIILKLSKINDVAKPTPQDYADQKESLKYQIADLQEQIDWIDHLIEIDGSK